MLRCVWTYRRPLTVVMATLLLLLPLPVVVGTKSAQCGSVLLLMSVLWVTESLPLAVTSMFPAVLFPPFGIMTSSQVASQYFKDFHLLLIGVVCFAASTQKWRLQRRVALKVVGLVGVDPVWLMLGFMSACALLSMWVHNTSAVMMMMPVVEAVLQQISRTSAGEPQGEENPGLDLDLDQDLDLHLDLQLDELDPERTEPGEPEEPRVQTWSRSEAQGEPCSARGSVRPKQEVVSVRPKQEVKLRSAVCLAVAYSSNIGGVATLPGTSPNLILSQYLSQTYPRCSSVNFGTWLLLCLPISVMMLLLTWLWLTWLFITSDFRFLWRRRGEESAKEKATRRVIEEEYKLLGPISPQEILTLVLFLLLVLLWLTRAPGFVPGWASVLFPSHSDFITDGTVALLLGLVLFVAPANGPDQPYEPMISWREFQASMPWEVSLLVGGGFALAEGTKESGLSEWVSQQLTPLGDLPVLATVAVSCIIVSTVTEVASNAATITIFLPILSPLAEAIQVNPLYLLLPATICTSFSFLLPVSNPPNAVVFSYGHVRTLDMVKAGLGVNVIGLLLLLLALETWAVPLFSLDLYPDWAPVQPGSNSTAAP